MMSKRGLVVDLARASAWVAVSLCVVALWSMCFCLWRVALGVLR